MPCVNCPDVAEEAPAACSLAEALLIVADELKGLCVDCDSGQAIPERFLAVEAVTCDDTTYYRPYESIRNWILRNPNKIVSETDLRRSRQFRTDYKEMADAYHKMQLLRDKQCEIPCTIPKVDCEDPVPKVNYTQYEICHACKSNPCSCTYQKVWDKTNKPRNRKGII